MWIREELLLDVPHRQVVFTVPKMLRIFFKYKRRLLGDLGQTAVNALLKYFEAATGAGPRCQGEMRIIAFLTDYAVVDRIINHLKLTFVADRPPPPHIAYQEVLMATEPSAEYIS